MKVVREIADIEEPVCQLGFTLEQVDRIMADRKDDWNAWIRGQTGGICEGREYNHETEEYFPTGCGPHGFVIFAYDVIRYLDGKRGGWD